MSFDLLQTGNIVSFSVQSSIIGGNFESVEVLAVAAAQIAAKEDDVKALHYQFKPYVPGMPDAYTDYAYLIGKLSNGTIRVLGLPWIIESSIQLSAKASYRIVITGVEPGDVESIRKGLTNRGLNIESFEKIE